MADSSSFSVNGVSAWPKIHNLLLCSTEFRSSRMIFFVLRHGKLLYPYILVCSSNIGSSWGSFECLRTNRRFTIVSIFFCSNPQTSIPRDTLSISPNISSNPNFRCFLSMHGTSVILVVLCQNFFSVSTNNIVWRMNTAIQPTIHSQLLVHPNPHKIKISFNGSSMHTKSFPFY